MLDLHRLQLLHHFSQQGSIAATAAALGYSASAVSQQLATLEREAGGALLDRTARSAELTVLGRRLAEHAAVVLEAVEATEVDLAAHTGSPAGPVRIAAVPSIAVALAPALAALMKRERDLEVVVRQAAPSEALSRLRSRDVDIAVVDDHAPAPPTTHDRLDAEVLLHDPLVVVLPRDHPAAAGPGPIALASLAAGPWICAPVGEPSRTAFDRVLTEAQVTPEARWEFEGLATIAALVAEGVGIAILPRLVVTAALRDRVVQRELRVPAVRAVVALTRTSSRGRPALEVALAALREAP